MLLGMVVKCKEGSCAVSQDVLLPVKESVLSFPFYVPGTKPSTLNPEQRCHKKQRKRV